MKAITPWCLVTIYQVGGGLTAIRPEGYPSFFSLASAIASMVGAKG